MPVDLIEIPHSTNYEYAGRHQELRTRLEEAFQAANENPSLHAVLLAGAHGTSVTVAAQVLSDWLHLGTFVPKALKPFTSVWATSLSELLGHLIAHPTDTRSTITSCVHDARHKKALLVVTDVEVLDDSYYDERLRAILAEQLLRTRGQRDSTGSPLLAIYQKKYNADPDPWDSGLVRLNHGYVGLSVGPYVKGRTGELAAQYGLANWLSKHVRFSVDATDPMHALEWNARITEAQLQKILADVVALEDGALLSKPMRLHTSLPYLPIWLVDDLVNSLGYPKVIRDIVKNALDRSLRIFETGSSEHPLYQDVETARVQITRLHRIVDQWQINRGVVRNADGTPVGAIPISRALVTSWLFGSNDAGFEWPPVDKVQMRVPDMAARHESEASEIRVSIPNPILSHMEGVPARSSAASNEKYTSHDHIGISVPSEPEKPKHRSRNKPTHDGSQPAPDDNEANHPRLPPKT